MLFKRHSTGFLEFRRIFLNGRRCNIGLIGGGSLINHLTNIYKYLIIIHLKYLPIPINICMINRGYKQGIFRPRHPEKCRSNSCVYRSGLELHYMRYLDSNPNIISWGSEDVVIPYIKPTDNKLHRYYVDFSLTIKDKNGVLHKFIIELKPEKQCKPPTNHGNKKKSTMFYEQVTYATNQCKWDAADQWAKKNGYKFQIMTEKQVKQLNIAK